jgi:hypothetical protein
MASQDITKVLVKDPILLSKDNINYAVMKGGQNITHTSFNATSESNSSILFNISVPTEQIIVSRKIYIQSTIKYTITRAGGPYTIANFNFDYGRTDALAPFPLHQLMNTQSLQINANTITMNVKDVLPALIKQVSMREFTKYNSTCPVMSDNFLNYEDADGSINNPLGSYNNGSIEGNDMQGRGAFALDKLTVLNVTGGGATEVDWYTPLATFNTMFVYVTVQEPLLISPCCFGNPSAYGGIYGIQNITHQINIDSTASRSWRSAMKVDGGGNQINFTYGVSFSNSKLNFLFLTPHPSDLYSARCVSPYMELSRYISTPRVQFNVIPTPDAAGNLTIDKKIITTSTITLNQIPDTLCVFLRKPIGEQNQYDSDFFFGIEACSISFNNNGGLLTNASQYDLWRMSRESGSTQSWGEFRGLVNSKTPKTGQALAPTSGSMLLLQFGRHIQLIDEFLAPGSLGTYSIQVTLTCYYQQTTLAVISPALVPVNRPAARLVPITPEVVMITQNSGIFVTSRGGSSVFTGLLSKTDVLDAASQEPYTHEDVLRMTGGSFLDTIKSAIGNIVPKLPTIAKHVLGAIDNPYTKAASSVLDTLGAGKSGGKKKSLQDRLVY